MLCKVMLLVYVRMIWQVAGVQTRALSHLGFDLDKMLMFPAQSSLHVCMSIKENARANVGG